MTDENEQKKPEARIIEMKTPVVGSFTAAAYILVEANLAKEWFGDAVGEAKRETEDALGSIRREIVFAVCFAESYIFEWAREVAGPTEVIEHFRFEEPFETVKEKWKGVPVRLHDAGLTATKSEPSIDWGQMGEVTKYRDGLVHGAASIPAGLTSEEGEAPEPKPALSELRRRGRGWALAAVLNVVGQLHQQTNTPLPEYLKDDLELL
ncbi:MAG: hypothetical protein ACOC6F_02835 [bacterium]